MGREKGQPQEPACLPWRPGAAVTKPHRPGRCKQRGQTLSQRILEGRSPISKCGQGRFLLRPPKMNPSQASLLASTSCPQSLACIGFCVIPILPPSSRMPPLCTFSVFSSVSNEDTSPGFRVHPTSKMISSSLPNYICKDLISNDAAFMGSGDQNLGAPIQLSMLTSKFPPASSVKGQGPQSGERAQNAALHQGSGRGSQQAVSPTPGTQRQARWPMKVA